LTQPQKFDTLVLPLLFFSNINSVRSKILEIEKEIAEYRFFLQFVPIS